MSLQETIDARPMNRAAVVLGTTRAALSQRLHYRGVKSPGQLSLAKLIEVLEKHCELTAEQKAQLLSGVSRTPKFIGNAPDIRGAIIELTKAEKIIIERICARQLATIPPFEAHVIEALNLLRGRT